MNLTILKQKLSNQYNYYIKRLNDEECKNEISKNFVLTMLSFIEKLQLAINNNGIYSFLNKKKNYIESIPFLLNEPKSYIFNQGYYINLIESEDRKRQIENIDFKIKMDRFNAIKQPNGNLGCSMSHINLLKSILKKEVTNENTYFLIIEDDIEILNLTKYKKLLINLNNLLTYHSPDMIVLSGTDKIIDKTSYYGFGFYKLLKSHTTSSYIINYKFIPELIKKYEIGVKGLLNINDKDENRIIDIKSNLYCCDQIWNNNIILENWMIYYDMEIIRPNLDFDSTIGTNGNKYELIEAFSTCIGVNKLFYNLRKELIYHSQFDLLKEVVKTIENLNNKEIECIYKSKII